jgi:hypothetical protein
MSSWIQRAKDVLKSIVEKAKKSCDENLKVRISFIGYRDHGEELRFVIRNFTEDVKLVQSFIDGAKATGGKDVPEDVTGGLNKCLEQKWEPNSTK